MDDNDDLRKRFDALSVPEFRRRIDLALGWVRELRRGLSVHAGMTLEQVPGPIPDLDPEQAQRAFHDIMEMLPLLRKPLSPEEKAKMIRPTPAQREMMAEVLDELAAHPEALEELYEEGEFEVTPEQITKLREGMVKSDMLGELEHEMRVFVEELQAYKQALVEQTQAVAAKLTQSRGPAN